MFIAGSIGPLGELGALDGGRHGALYAEHARFVYYLALRLMGDEAQAEDATVP